MIFKPSRMDYRKYEAYEIGIQMSYAICVVCSHLILTIAYKKARATILSPLSNLTILFSFMFEFMVLGVNFSLTDFVGIIILVVSYLLKYYLQVSQAPDVKPRRLTNDEITSEVAKMFRN